MKAPCTAPKTVLTVTGFHLMTTLTTTLVLLNTIARMITT